MNNRGEQELKEVLIKIVLGQIRKLHESAERTGENFNVFSILDSEKTHSAIIAELLNPQGSHNQGTLFLKLFLDQLQKKLQKKLRQLRENLEQIQEDELDKFRVKVETTEEGKVPGQIDILIESVGIKSGNVCIVVENKIHYAGDQKRQLGRYYEYALDTRKKPCIIYLTRKGDEPEDRTLNGDEPDKIPPCRRLPKDTVVCLSYKDFIVKWLDNCIKKVPRITQIRKTLHQYQMTVRKLTGRLPPEVEDILNGLGEKDDIIKGVQHKLQYDFWMELKEQLVKEELVDENSKFQLYISVNNDIEIPDEKLGQHIGCSFLGLTFSIPNGLLDDEEHEVVFRVDYQTSEKHYSFNYGFVFCKKDTLQRDKIEQKYEEIITPYVISKHKAYTTGWISWKYLQYEHELVSFIMESKETLIKKLVSEINLALALVETRKNNKT